MAMKKATVTYTAPPGEAKTLTIGETTLVSGKSDTVICEEAIMDKLKAAGGSLKVDGISDYTPPAPKPDPEPPKKEKSA